MLRQVLFLALLALLSQVVNGQVNSGRLSSAAPTAVPILRQINTHNQDGSYTYGYEGGDGSYKIETKGVSGEVKGKYGYYDDQGQLREIEYGANNHGFVPTGTGIHPELSERAYLAGQEVNQRRQGQPSGSNFEDDGQYRPDEYEAPYAYRSETPEVAPAPYYPLQGQQAQGFPSNQGRTSERLGRRHHQGHYAAPGSYETQNLQPQQQYQESSFSENVFQGHPASNINLNSGTYSIAY